MSSIVFAGTPAVAVPSLEAFLNAGVTVAAVLTREDAPQGRKRILTPSPLALRAAELGIPVIKANRITEDVVRELAATGAQVGAVVAYGALLPQAALDALPLGWVNLHFSLLPAWRGAAPVQHAIINGDEFLGASAFVLEAGLDTGPVIGTLVESPARDETSGTALAKLSLSGSTLLVQSVLALVSGAAEPRPQQGEISLAPKLGLADGRLDWEHDAITLDRRIRGVTPEPGAWTTLNEQRLKIGSARLPEQHADVEPVHLAPGEVALNKKRVLVGTGNGSLELLEVQVAGKKMMAAPDWARGVLNAGQSADGVVLK